MKTIFTLVSMLLIICTCVTSAVLFLNESYTLSAGLCFVWIVSLTLWIGKAIGLVDLMFNKTFANN
jgi:hypothetical protein